MRYFSVVNFEKYQHYKKEGPPWIKLHFAILFNYEFSFLSDAVKLQLFLIWLLASKHRNRLPWDAEWIQKEIKVTSPVELQTLKNAGFIEDSRESLERV